jgi:hypothetical protein
MLRTGPAGILRLAKNRLRLAAASEAPVRPELWEAAMCQLGFEGVSVDPLAHNGGIAAATKPK